MVHKELLAIARSKSEDDFFDFIVSTFKNSSRRIDFVINNNGKLYFIEVNFYGGSGSKLKSTATEYTRMYHYWANQNIKFIWVTDGNGWHSTLRPLREYFNNADNLLNLELLKLGALEKMLLAY